MIPDQVVKYIKQNYIILVICLLTLMVCSLTLLRLGIERENTAKHWIQFIKVRGCGYILESNESLSFKIPDQPNVIHP